MKRRDFLVGGMGALAAGVTGCAGIGQVIAPNWPNITPLQMNRFLTSLDGSMNQVTENPEGGRFLSEFRGQPPSEKNAQFFRQGMRSLLLVGNFGDLSVAGQVHPGVQKRLQYSAPEIDAAVSGATDQIKSLSPTERADMQSALREDSTLGDRVLEVINLEASAVGASNRRLMQLHVMGKHIIERLKHSSDMFISEYVRKCEKLTAVPGSVAEAQRFMAARMGKTAFKTRLKEAENAAQYWQRQHIEDIPIGYQLVAQENTNSNGRSDNPHQEEPKPQELSKKEDIITQSRTDVSGYWYRVGARMFGIGAVMTGVGWMLIAIGGSSDAPVDPDNVIGGVGMILGITVGPIVLFISLIPLLIGALS